MTAFIEKFIINSCGGGHNRMKSHVKKTIAPIVITLITVLYFIFFGINFISAEDCSFLTKLLGGGIPLVFVAINIYVLIERINEIRNGEEDDLSKY